jgi:drug/metabolite transporter (DMT)-like permease
LDFGDDPRVSAGAKSPALPNKDAVVDSKEQPSIAPSSDVLIGTICGVVAAFGWATGFVVAKHGITIGFSPADLAFHRFFWSGLILMPLALRAGFIKLGDIGWGRGFALTITSGPPQALMAYTGFILVPLGHGTVIQPACAALAGLILASLVLGERVTMTRIVGGAVIVAGLIVFAAESLTTIGTHGVGGDLLFVGAGVFWATFGTLLRMWRVPGLAAAAVVGAFSVGVFTPLYIALAGFGNMISMGLMENVVQALAQGIFAGALPIFLFARSVMLLGAGRAATFPALVPGFALIIGYFGAGIVPSIPQIIGLVIVVIGFRFVVK